MRIIPSVTEKNNTRYEINVCCNKIEIEGAEVVATAQFAGRFFDAPICLITILGECHLWHEHSSGSLDESFLHEISPEAKSFQQIDRLEVPDLLLDPIFSTQWQKLVHSGVRYYCGIPLKSKNRETIGHLAIMDTAPRDVLTNEQFRALKTFAIIVSSVWSIERKEFYDYSARLLSRSKLEEDVKCLVSAQVDFTFLVFDFIPAHLFDGIVRAVGFSFARELILLVKARVAGKLGPHFKFYKVSQHRFCLILNDQSNVTHLCELMLSALKVPIYCQNVPVPLDVGIGLLQINSRHHKNQDLEWLRRAVSAAEKARRTPRRYAWYQKKDDVNQHRAFIVLSALVEALRAEGQLSVYLQPQFELNTGYCRSAEALLRWNHPTFGNISPAEFIPLVEQSALMVEVSAWVLDEVIRMLAKTSEMNFKISINVTPRDLEGVEFVDRLLSGLERHSIESTRIQLEFTESGLIQNLDAVQQQLQRAKSAGVEVAVDDFGTGYSNWVYLSNLPVSVVKIDRSLIKGSTVSDQDRVLVRSLISLADSLGYRVIAEGVESIELLESVRALGFDEVQGFYLAKPMPFSEFETWFLNMTEKDSLFSA